jgi:hypothetical protein
MMESIVRRAKPALLASVLGGFVASSDACRDLTGTRALPVGVSDPANFRTPAGAVAAYWGAMGLFRDAFSSFINTSGEFTDELANDQHSPLDARQHQENEQEEAYRLLQRSRNQAGLAISALTTYANGDPSAPPALRGELYALQGYTEVMLADLFCSGIPLSTLDFERDFTYKPGSTTTQVYEDAIARFDSATTLGKDSARVVDLARLGKGRALVALGRYAQAAAVVAPVSTDFTYQYLRQDEAFTYADLTVADREGRTGLPYISSNDPRSAALQIGTFSNTRIPQFLAQKYLPADVPTPRVVASGIEARLIQAEAALQANDQNWLTILNTLRTDGAVTGLPLLTDPGLDPIPTGKTAMDVRVDLLFRERAYWLFLTGERQGDLRRLVRQYHRRSSDVYPSFGSTLGGMRYGEDVNVPVTTLEEGANPFFHGCLGREA